MNHFSDLKSVIKSLRYTILAPFIMILLVIIFIWIVTIHDLRLKHSTLVKQELLSTSKLFESILSQKLKIVAASPDFIRFMQSGKITRKNIEINFLRQISKIYSPMLIGMSIKNFDEGEAFNDGIKSNVHVTLTVCYLNGNINDQFGNCNLHWTLYFNERELLHELTNINENIHSCVGKKCDNIEIFNGHNFGDFLIDRTTPISFEVSVRDSSTPTNTIFLVFIFILFLLGIWIYTRINKIINLSLSNPLSETILSLQNGLQPNSKNYIKEFKYLSDEIANYYDVKENAKIGKIAGDVVHDLKPYICCLHELISKNKHFNYDDKNKIDKTINEIESMMYSILNKYGHKTLLSANPLKPLSYSLHDIFIDATEYAKVVCEARGVKLSVIINGSCYSVFVINNPLLFSRMLLNLVQNSIEAASKNISISLNCCSCAIEITDDGCGINQEILQKIGTEHITHGKPNGHGIGLFETSKTIESWGGSIKIDSLLNSGTTVILNFKKSPPPATFVSDLDAKKYDLIIVIDDDEMIHKKWRSIIDNRITALTFFSPGEFISKKHKLNIDKTLFLVDQQFSKKYDVSGISFIVDNKLQHQSILVTSKPNDEFVISECTLHNIRILPKNNISICPLSFI